MFWLFTLWLVFVFIQFLFWAILFPRFTLFYKAPQNKKSETPPVSVIICARNEQANLQKNLPIILQQDYPSYEVIVVNDASEDDSEKVLTGLKEQFLHLLTVTETEKVGFGKKGALKKGIAKAQNDWLLLTDADCRPVSDQWIRGMLAQTDRKTSVVLGYGPQEHRGGFVAVWLRLETIFVAMQYFSMALWGSPYMGVGRNLMYRKSLFIENQGFNGHRDLASGDDDLFVNGVATQENTIICTDPKTFMYSEPKQSFWALYKQKSRHYSTSTRYRPIHQLILGLLSGSHFVFWLLFWILLIDGSCNFWLFLLLMIRESLLLLNWAGSLQQLKDLRLLACILLFDIFLPLYYFIFAPTLFIKDKSFWR